MQNKIKKQSVALDSLTRRIILEVCKAKATNFSSSLRIIVREWSELQPEERYKITELGREALKEENPAD